MKARTEVGLKFTLPSAGRAGVREAMDLGVDNIERSSMATLYLDTDECHLAKAGLEWQLRREGRRWIQSLRSARESGHGWSEHEVIRPRARFDEAQHAGTSIGERLAVVLHAARQHGAEVGVRSQSEVRRQIRRVRTRGAVVEVCVDEGRLLSDQAARPFRGIEFRLVSGSMPAMLGVVERWRKRHGLLFDPRSEAERGEELVTPRGYPPVRKAGRPDYPRDATAQEAFGRVLDECLAHITRNVVGLIDGDPDLRVEHVHQLRVGIRRLRSALRSFQGWIPAVPAELVDGLRALFDTLGQARDADVLSTGVMAALKKLNAPVPSPTVALEHEGPDPKSVVLTSETQRLLLAWMGWRMTLDEPAKLLMAKDLSRPNS